MARHRYVTKSGKVYTKTKGCLDGTKSITKELGVVCSEDHYKKTYPKFEPIIKEFERFGFKLHIKQLDDGNYYLYSVRSEYPTVASYMVTVSLARYFTLPQTRINAWTKRWLLFRKHFRFTETCIFTEEAYPHMPYPICYLSFYPRIRPKKDVHRRQNGESVFQTRKDFSGWNDPFNSKLVVEAVRKFYKKPSPKLKRKIHDLIYG